MFSHRMLCTFFYRLIEPFELCWKHKKILAIQLPQKKLVFSKSGKEIIVHDVNIRDSRPIIKLLR